MANDEQTQAEKDKELLSQAAAAMGRRGGPARAASMTREERIDNARLAANSRWARRKPLPPVAVRKMMKKGFRKTEAEKIFRERRAKAKAVREAKAAKKKI